MVQIKVRPRILLFAGALLVLSLTALAMLLFPRQQNLSRYQAMYQQGEYSALNPQLERALKVKSNWHEARELLIKSQMAAGAPVAALENLLFLLATGQDSQQDGYIRNQLAQCQEALEQGRVLLADSLEKHPTLDRARIFWIELETNSSNLAPDSAAALDNLIILAQKGKSQHRLEKQVAGICIDPEASFDLLDRSLALDPDFTWAREMKLQIALEQKLAPLTFSLLQEALESGSGQQDLLSRAWGTILPENCTGALELALLAGNQDWIQQVLERAEMPDFDYQELPQLLELLPQEPRLWVLQAIRMEDPREGLDILLDLEESGYEPQDYRDYGEKKMSLIHSIGRCDSDWLTFVPVELIAEQALRWGDSRARGLVDWLEANCEDSYGEIDMLRQITEYRGKAPKPIASLSFLPVDLALSPDGKWLLASDPESQMVFVDLGSGKEYPVQPWWGPWVWSPDSKRVAAIETGARVNILYLYTPNTQVPQAVEMPQPSSLPKPEILGWLDNATLLLSSPLGPGDNRSIAVAVKAATGEIQWQSEAREGWPLLTPAGTLTWIWHDQGDLCIDRDGEVIRFDIESRMDEFHVGVSPLEWFPKGDRLLVQAPFTPFTADILYMESGEIDSAELPFFYRPGNWADEDKIWGFVSYDNFVLDYNALARFNLETGKRQYAGLHFQATKIVWDSQGNLMAIGTEQGTTVYRIPGN